MALFKRYLQILHRYDRLISALWAKQWEANQFSIITNFDPRFIPTKWAQDPLTVISMYTVIVHSRSSPSVSKNKAAPPFLGGAKVDLLPR